MTYFINPPYFIELDGYGSTYESLLSSFFWMGKISQKEWDSGIKIQQNMDKSRHHAKIMAAEPLIAKILGLLSGTNYTTQQINRAMSALFALEWDPSVIASLGPTRITRLLPRLEISRLS